MPLRIQVRFRWCESLSLMLIALWWCGCSGEPDWPEPTAGFSTESANYEDRYPDPPYVHVPKIPFFELNGSTVPLELPAELPARAPLGFEGEFIFPEDFDHGSGIWVVVYFTPEGEERGNARMQARAEGPNGRYKFHFNQRVPFQPGEYRVEVAAMYTVLTDDPAATRKVEFVSTPVAVGDIVLTEPQPPG